ncbi:hypothetical protein [Aquicoccus sp. SU-CL01552]|uniref:hypothetical protein n=1 Tax=Aquicoccus sp. SU-CL01552 TaxID=3127656 RepID=UPI0031086464
MQKGVLPTHDAYEPALRADFRDRILTRAIDKLPGLNTCMRGEFKLNDLINHAMGLDDINTAFDLMHAGKSLRAVIHFDKERDRG